MRSTVLDTSVDEPVGVLVMRVWYEGAGPGRQLRVRVTGRLDVVCDDEESSWSTSIAESVETVRRWLERFAGSDEGGLRPP